MITGKHEMLLEKFTERAERLMKGAIYHAEDLDDPRLTEEERNNHQDNMYLHGKAVKALVDNFINDL